MILHVFFCNVNIYIHLCTKKQTKLVDPTLCQLETSHTRASPTPIRNWGLPTGPTMGSRTCSYCDFWSIDAFGMHLGVLKKMGLQNANFIQIPIVFFLTFLGAQTSRKPGGTASGSYACLGPNRWESKPHVHKPLATLASTIINHQKPSPTVTNHS